MNGPYPSAAHAYLGTGLGSPLPLPPRMKSPPPDGYTGHDGLRPSGPDVEEWCAAYPDGNIGLRVADDVLGIDVDDYSGKCGGQTLASLVERFGPLPPTWISTSRDDGVSGIRFFRVPEGLRWPGILGPGIEVIRAGHRYAVVAPSIHPDTGGTYRWVGVNGYDDMPLLEFLPELPAAWVTGITGGEAFRPDARASLGNGEALAWVQTHGAGEPCRKVVEVGTKARDALLSAAAGSRHESALTSVNELLFLALAGHPGVGSALTMLRGVFLDAVTGSRDPVEAENEWRRNVDGGVAIVAAKEARYGDPCERHRDDGPPPPEPPSEDAVEAFWQSSPELAHVRAFAASRLAPPWAVLGCVLARVLAHTPPWFQLPDVFGSRGSLNFLVALVAPSGLGKGIGEDVSQDVLGWPTPGEGLIAATDLVEVPLGSGEGIAKTYRTWVPPKGKEPGRYETLTTRALFLVDEIDALAAQASRNGATVVPTLRSAYSGKQLGAANATAERRLIVARGSYRMCAIVGVQPERGAAIFDDDAGGTPQRFVWLPAVDPTMVDPGTEEPPPLPWKPPILGMGQKVEAAPSIRARLRAQHVERQRGTGHVLDSHRGQTHLKVAVALALLEGGTRVEEDHWQRAEVIMAVSDVTRNVVGSSLRRKKADEDVKRGYARARVEVAVEEDRERRNVEQARKYLLARLGRDEETLTEGLTRKALKDALGRRLRAYRDEALAGLLAGGAVVERKGRLYLAPEGGAK